MSYIRFYSVFLVLTLTLLISFPNISKAQIVQPSGKVTEASSQLVYFYDLVDSDSTLFVTNTNDTESVWIHVQIFRSFGPINNPTICDERDFVDLLTPNDAHIYDLSRPNLPKNIGETQTTAGESTSLSAQLSDTLGFVVITPIVSEADFTAISFQNMIGHTFDNDEQFIINAMGRDAVDFSSGVVVPDGTPLDGVTNGFVVLQPSEFQFNFASDDFNLGNGRFADIIGIAFLDQYGPPGLLGYQVLPGSAGWTSFLFDYKEDPTSCGNRPVDCLIDIGLNDTIPDFNMELTDQLLCSGASTPEYPYDGLGNDAHESEFFGWGRIFVSGLDALENHVALVRYEESGGGQGGNDHPEGADWMHTK